MGALGDAEGTFGELREDTEKQFIRDMLGTNHSQTEVIHSIVELVGAYWSARGTIATGRLSFSDKLDLLSLQRVEMKFGPPFNINPAELTSTPLLALAVWAAQDAYIRARNALRGFGASGGSVSGGTFSGLQQGTNTLQPEAANDFFKQFDERMETLRRSYSGAGVREPRFFRDDAFDRMMHDRSHAPRGDFGASDTTRGTA